jgi:hypothetical protein
VAQGLFRADPVVPQVQWHSVPHCGIVLKNVSRPSLQTDTCFPTQKGFLFSARQPFAESMLSRYKPMMAKASPPNSHTIDIQSRMTSDRVVLDSENTIGHETGDS